MSNRVRSESQTGEATKERRTVYFTCPNNLLLDLEQVGKMRGFLSKDEAIRQAIREFVQNYTPDYVDAARNTEVSIMTMAQLWEKYPNLPSMLAALKAHSAG